MRSADQIKVIGVGTGGGHMLNAMLQGGVEGITCAAVNTDVQALHHTLAPLKVPLGPKFTKGLGAGANPRIAKLAAFEDPATIAALVRDAETVIIVAGMGGGTGTGASPVLATAAKACGTFTLAVVTMPFRFEGHRRQTQAEVGLLELQRIVDTLIVIPLTGLLKLIPRNIPLNAAFGMGDSVARSVVQVLADVLTNRGLVTPADSDVTAALSAPGITHLGIGRAAGEHAAKTAAENALTSPLLEEMPLAHASRLLVHIAGDPDTTFFDIREIHSVIRSAAHSQAQIITCLIRNEKMPNETRVTLLATSLFATI